MNATLVILAAGIGARYGSGLKTAGGGRPCR